MSKSKREKARAVMWVGILENLSNWFAPRAVNEVSRSFSKQDFVFVRTNARTVQKQARRGSRGSEDRSLVSLNECLISRAINEVSRSFSYQDFVFIRTNPVMFKSKREKACAVMWVRILENLSNRFAPRAANEVSFSENSRNFKLSHLHRAGCSKASETRLARVWRQEFSKT